MTPEPFSLRFGADSLIVSTAACPVRKRDRGELIPLLPSVYIPESLIDVTAPRWHVRRQVQVARILATGVSRERSAQRMITMEAALIVRGLPSWMGTYDIHYRTLGNGSPGRCVEAPCVRVGETLVPEVAVRKVVADRLSSRFDLVRGVPVASLEETILDLVRLAHPLMAYVDVSVALSELCRFDTRQIPASRRRENRVKEILIGQLEPIRNRRGYRRALELIKKADAGIDTPPEGVLLWLLHILLRNDRSQLAHFESQYPVVVRGELKRADVGFPNLKLFIEFDGRGKLIKDDEGAQNWIDRQQRFQQEGWTPLRFTTSNLNNLAGVADEMTRVLSSFGLRVSPLGGPLWKELPSYFSAPIRRN